MSQESEHPASEEFVPLEFLKSYLPFIINTAVVGAFIFILVLSAFIGALTKGWLGTVTTLILASVQALMLAVGYLEWLRRERVGGLVAALALVVAGALISLPLLDVRTRSEVAPEEAIHAWRQEQFLASKVQAEQEKPLPRPVVAPVEPIPADERPARHLPK